MDRILRSYCKILEAVSAACLLVMVVLVLGNVILRYVFNSGITVSEELSRWLFVWVTFLGATFALRERGHLGTEILVGQLGPTGKKFCLTLGHGLMLFVCWLLFQGALAQTKLNWDVSAPSSGASLAWFYSAGIVFSVSAGAILAHDAYQLLTGRVADDDLIIIKESEDQA